MSTTHEKPLKLRCTSEEVTALEAVLDMAFRFADEMPAGLTLINGNAKVGDNTALVNARDHAIDEVTKAATLFGYTVHTLDEDGCQWDPKTGRRARAGDEHNANHKATVKVGKHRVPLCEACSTRGHWKRAKIREAI